MGDTVFSFLTHAFCSRFFQWFHHKRCSFGTIEQQQNILNVSGHGVNMSRHQFQGFWITFPERGERSILLLKFLFTVHGIIMHYLKCELQDSQARFR